MVHIRAKILSMPGRKSITAPSMLTTKPAARLTETDELNSQTNRVILQTHQPTNPYRRCVRVKLRKLNAESPSKNAVSGIAPPAVSRLNHPLDAI